MKLKLTIDIRERDLMVCCRMIIDKHALKDAVILEGSALPIGDIIISDDDTKVDKIIIERKTLNDLSASIKDGRYAEQSFRLNGLNHPNHNIIYLIEGDLTKGSIFKSRIDKQMLYSSIFSINYFKGFSVMRSNTLEESATIICNMVFKLLKSESRLPYYTIEPVTLVSSVTDEQSIITEPISKPVDYCSVVKRVKKENVTKENIGNIMLCQIPGISDTTANAIFTKFKTITELIITIKQDTHCLDDIKTVMANGKSRKISKSSIQSIIDFLKD